MTNSDRPVKTVASAIVASLVIAATLVSTTAAEAAIRCSKGFQRVQGNDISTPYCQDEYLAQVARQYGVSASGARVRNNPSFKREVCRFVGRDIRVQQNCVDELPGRNRF